MTITVALGTSTPTSITVVDTKTSISLFENADRAGEVLEQNKLQMHKDEVFCFTPNGDIFNLPLGATAVDFAYAVHSAVGNNCVGAKINSVISPLRQKLENGDQVEIITAKNAKPSPNWLQFVATPKAKSSIKHFIRNEKFDEHRNLGRTILHKFFASKHLELNDAMIEKNLNLFNAKNLDNLFVRIAEGVVTRQDVLAKLYPNYQDWLEKYWYATAKMCYRVCAKGGQFALMINNYYSLSGEFYPLITDLTEATKKAGFTYDKFYYLFNRTSPLRVNKKDRTERLVIFHKK